MKKVLYVAMGAVLFSIGCGKKVEDKVGEKILEKIIENKSNGAAKVDLAKGTMKIESDQGTISVASGGSAKIPDNFPSDVFVYKPATIGSVVEAQQGVTLAMKTTKEIGEVTEAYKTAMTGKGWKQKSAADMGTYSMLVYEKDKRTTTIAVSKQRDSLNILLNVATK